MRFLITYSVLFFSFLFPLLTFAQGQALSADTTKKFLNRTQIGGYGTVYGQWEWNTRKASANVERFVLFLGHSFSPKLSVFGELEVEDAKISGGEKGGEVALEQAYLKFNINPSHYITAGLFIPRFGYINENHLPTQYNSNERHMVERYIIPSTWREIGIGYYGQSNTNGLQWSAALLNGLNSSGFKHGSFIRGGRFEGSDAGLNSLALTSSIGIKRSSLSAQFSAYYGGTTNLISPEADSLQLSSGLFGAGLGMAEFNLQYEAKGFSIRTLGTAAVLPEASSINRAYANNVPLFAYGAYLELAYNILEEVPSAGEHKLTVFSRYERMDLNSQVPENGIYDGTLNQHFITSGLHWQPHTNVSVKADVRIKHTGNENPDLVINPGPLAIPYERTQLFSNLGIGFSF